MKVILIPAFPSRRRGRKEVSFRPIAGFLFFVSLVIGMAPRQASAVPAYARQTGQPCQTCHVGAFGPQLTPFGRDFKLNGYTLSDGWDHFPPLAVGIQSSFTHTAADQPQSPAPNAGFGAAGPNNNFAVDQIELFWGGQITPSIGAFIQETYSEVSNGFHWDDMDVRYAHPGELFDMNYVAGITLNNHPTIQDLWNSTPAFGFPYVASSMAPGSSATTQIDNMLAQRVIGVGAYSMWNDWLLTEFDLYAPLDRSALNALGIVPVSGATLYHGATPYWRLALQHGFGDHYFELGTYGLQAENYPGGDQSAGTTDKFTDIAFDANYQWTGNRDHFISAHTTLIREQAKLDASSILAGANSSDRLTTFRADLTYSWHDTLVPTVQYFNKQGSNDANFWGTDNGSPNSAGFITELTIVPFGKSSSFSPFYNMRFDIQYVTYTKFNGTSSHAWNNNSLYLNLWLIGAAW